MESSSEKGSKSPEKVNIIQLIAPYLQYWYLIILSALVFSVATYLNLSSKNKVYSSSAQVLVKDQPNSGTSSELDIFSDLGISRNRSNIYNKIIVLTSRPLIRKVVKALELNIEISEEQGIFKPDAYYYGDKLPFIVNTIQADSSLEHNSITLAAEFSSETEFQLMEIVGDEMKKLGNYTFSQDIKTPIGIIRLDENKANLNVDKKERTFLINLNSITSATNKYKSSFSAKSIGDQSTVLSLSVSGKIPEQNEDFLNKLVDIHELQTIKDKNEITLNTSRFIDDRMKLIEEELTDVEKTSEAFKVDNKLFNVEIDAANYATKEGELDKLINQILIERKLINFISDYLTESREISMLLPADLGISQGGVNTLIESYNELVLERNRIVNTSSEQNPIAVKLGIQIQTLRDNLNASLQNLKESKNIELRELRSKEQLYNNKLSNIPEYERKYREIARQQQIKETLYLYLLQKREENQIAMASAVGNIQVVEKAITANIPISPKRKGSVILWFVVGLAIPIGLIYLKEMLDTKVHSRDDLEGMGIPVVVEIPQHKEGSNLVIHKEVRSVVAEAFRMLRNNMNFLLPKNKEGGSVIFLSSSIAGEGKTFNSINLAHSLALIDKKVVLVGLDLRAPKITEYLDMVDGPGVTNYLINENLTLDDITYASKDLDNLDYIISGDIPPNPSELLMRSRVDVLFDELRKKYDYIIVDNAPTTLVVDTMSIIHHSDLFLFVVRANYLDKRILTDIVEMKKSDKVKNLAFILNDVDFKHSAYKSYGYRYGYGYGYGAGNVYGEDPKAKRGLFNRLRRKR